MSNRYTLQIDSDEHGELFITFPDFLLEDLGWMVGDVVEYVEENDGSLIIKKSDDDAVKEDL
jgi:bifunctional DNA-binding transcriptional regulator/antitoxin component of YhaV-PrlF toxin-antitoxin module